MPSRLTTAGQRWIEIAQRHPSLDSTPILKLAQFAAKLDTDERKLRRLARVADRHGFLPSDITIATELPIETVEQILASIDTDHQPSEDTQAFDTVIALARTVTARQRHHERLEWWCDRAARQGWDVAEIHAASQLSKVQVEELVAEVLAEREARTEALCSFCGKCWHEQSIYCRDVEKHTKPGCAKRQ